MTNYKVIQTEDGSKTLYSKLYDENCHSTSGAISETILHYIEGCKIKDASKFHCPLRILEVGFGAGVGFLETRKALKDSPFEFLSLEIDEELIHIFEKEQNIKFIQNENIFIYSKDNYQITIFLGDARKTISKVKDKFHAIYQDAFSPKRNAILWTTQWFKELKNLAHPDCIMSTYSASSSIRKSMINAGWKLYSGEKFGTKRSSTRARLNGETDAEILDKLSRSHVDELTDNNYQEYTMDKNEKNKNL